MEILDLYRSMTTRDLLDLRAALLIDGMHEERACHAEGVAFVLRRLQAVTQVLRERGSEDADADRVIDRCAVCGKVLGVGIRALHLGRCEDHPEVPS